jgi:hypothetical protein
MIVKSEYLELMVGVISGCPVPASGLCDSEGIESGGEPNGGNEDGDPPHATSLAELPEVHRDGGPGTDQDENDHGEVTSESNSSDLSEILGRYNRYISTHFQTEYVLMFHKLKFNLDASISSQNFPWTSLGTPGNCGDSEWKRTTTF